MKLSIVIPALNQEVPIGRAIQQFWKPAPADRIEVIVVDGGSQDGTPLVARLLADRLVAFAGAADHWRSAARNAGAAAAQGDVILFIEPEARLSTSIESMTEQLAELFGNGRKIACAVPAATDALRATVQGEAPAGWLAVQREAFLGCGGFNGAPAGQEELELLSRIGRHGLIESVSGLEFVTAEPAQPELEEIAA